MCDLQVAGSLTCCEASIGSLQNPSTLVANGQTIGPQLLTFPGIAQVILPSNMANRCDIFLRPPNTVVTLPPGSETPIGLFISFINLGNSGVTVQAGSYKDKFNLYVSGGVPIPRDTVVVPAQGQYVLVWTGSLWCKTQVF